MTKPDAIYVWLVPSEEVLEQPGSWRIRKWQTEPFPEANYTAMVSEKKTPELDAARAALLEACGYFTQDKTATVGQRLLQYGKHRAAVLLAGYKEEK